jgi:hypothetical protein
MSKKLTIAFSYDADVEQVWVMMTDRDYWEAKYAALGAREVSFAEFRADGDAFIYTSVRNVPADLPSVAKKVVGDTNTVTTTERWTRAGDSASATIEIRVKNVPGGTTGTMTLAPSGGQTRWSFDFDAKVGLPVIGGKLESIMNEQTREQLGQEKEFNDTWLAGRS